MTVPVRPADAVPYDADIAGAAALIADPARTAILRALDSGRPLAAGELARLAGVSAATASFHLAKLLDGGLRPAPATTTWRVAPGVELLDSLLASRLIEKDESSSRTSGGDTFGSRFEVTGAGARTLGSFGINIGEVRRARRHFAGECIDWTQRRGHLNGALAAAITARLFEVGWIEHGFTGPRRRTVRITAAGGVGLAGTFGFRAG